MRSYLVGSTSRVLISIISSCKAVSSHPRQLYYTWVESPKRLLPQIKHSPNISITRQCAASWNFWSRPKEHLSFHLTPSFMVDQLFLHHLLFLFSPLSILSLLILCEWSNHPSTPFSPFSSKLNLFYTAHCCSFQSFLHTQKDN